MIHFEMLLCVTEYLKSINVYCSFNNYMKLALLILSSERGNQAHRWSGSSSWIHRFSMTRIIKLKFSFGSFENHCSPCYYLLHPKYLSHPLFPCLSHILLNLISICMEVNEDTQLQLLERTPSFFHC